MRRDNPLRSRTLLARAAAAAAAISALPLAQAADTPAAPAANSSAPVAQAAPAAQATQVAQAAPAPSAAPTTPTAPAPAASTAEAPAPATPTPPKASKAEVSQTETVIVTGTARREGLRKLEAGFSITTADDEQIKQAAPTTAADLLKIVPGVFAETTGGNGGGANIRVRGFPMDGDSPYTTLQLNGAPVYPAPTLSFFDNASLFRLDDTIERVEILRGGSSPIYGNGQPGITVNFIQKKGDSIPEGGIRLTGGTGALKRVDGYYAGPLGEQWGVALGGFYRSSDGVRNTDYPADRGGQFSLRLTRKLDDGELSLSARSLHDRNAFFTAVPLISSNNGSSLTAFPGFDPLKDTLYGSEMRHIKLETGPGAASGSTQKFERDLADGRGAKASIFGATLDKKFGGWSLSSTTGYTSADTPTYALFTGANPQTLGSFIQSQIGSANGNAALVSAAGRSAGSGSATYANGGGAITDMNKQVITAGMWTVDKQLQSFTNETRLSREVGGGHTLTFGLYAADYSSKDLWYLGNPMLMTVEPHARLIDLRLDNGLQLTRNGYIGAPTFAVNADYNGRNIAGFLADEWKVNSALTVDGGVRLERQKITGTLENLSSGNIDNNLLTVYNNDATFFNGTFRTLNYADSKASWTLGANYNFSRQFSAFVRANQGHKFPSFDDLRDGKQGTENIKQLEVGLKTDSKLYTAFVTAYVNRLSNSQFQVFTLAGNEVSHGGSKTLGLEFEGSVRPLPGLELAITGNLQDAKYENFGENTGHKVSRQPKAQFRFTPSYKIPTEWGPVRVHATWTHVGDRFGDHANLQVLPKYDTIDLGLSAALNNGLTVRLSATNVTNELGITEGNPRLSGTGVSSSGVFLGRPLFGRAFEMSVGYAF